MCYVQHVPGRCLCFLCIEDGYVLVNIERNVVGIFPWSDYEVQTIIV